MFLESIKKIIILLFLLGSFPSFADICSENVLIHKFFDKEGNQTPLSISKYFKKNVVTSLGGYTVLNYGYTKKNLFLSIKVKKTEIKKKCYLELGSPNISNIEIYKIHKDDRVTQKAKIGASKVFSQRLVNHRNFLFPFDLKKDREFVVKINTHATMQIPIKVYTKDNFIARTSGDYLMLGLFFGLLFLITLWGIQNFFALGDISFLFYALYSASIAFFFLERDGISYQFLLSDALWWKPRGVRIFAIISGLSGVIYTASFLGKRFLKNKLCLLYYSICIVCILSIGILDVSKTPQLTIVGAGFSPLIMLFISTKAIKQNPLAKFLAIASLINILGVLIYSSSVLNISDANFFTDNSMKIATIFEFFFLNIGITKKIKRYATRQALASILSHEVRKPIDKFDRIIKRLPFFDDNEKLKTYLKSSEINDDIEATRDLIRNVLDLSQKPKLQLKDWDIRQVFQKLLKQYPLVQLKVNFTHKSTALLDKAKVKRTFEIILDNAYEAIKNKKNSYISLETTEDEKFVWIKILNNNSRIKKEDIGQIFDLFKSFGKSNGRGIGLSIAEKTINAHKGAKIYVESNFIDAYGHPSHDINLKEDYVVFWIKFPKTIKEKI
jgi:signal transduction histidine kinase